jgi:hypothetical protein
VKNKPHTKTNPGTAISPDLLTGPASPTRKLRITTRSSSVPNAPRSVPNSAGLAMQEQWNPTFSPVTTAVDRSPSLADVSPVSTTLRWNSHPQPSPAMSDPGVPTQQMEHSMPQPSPLHYGYLMDNGERTITYTPSSDPMMQPYPTPVGSEPVNGYGTPQHSGPQMTPGVPSPAFAQYPATPQSFHAQSPHPHDMESNLQMMAPQRTSVDSMYSMPAPLKDE